MPTLDTNRRMIARGIIQLYATDDNEGGGGMIKTGSIVGNGTMKTYNVGFRPKAVLLAMDDVNGDYTYILTEYGYFRLIDYGVADYNNTNRVVTKQTVRNITSSVITFTDTGFTSEVDTGVGFYIAMG